MRQEKRLHDNRIADFHSYCDLPYNNHNYNYIDVVIDQHKYCTLSYDRQGLASSSHGDPVNEIQASIEVAPLAELTILLQDGKYPGAMYPFKKVTHIGYGKLSPHELTTSAGRGRHSFGSALTYALVNADPTFSDGIVLTGFTLSSSFMDSFLIGSNFVQAYLNQPFRFGNVSDSAATVLTAFIKQPIPAFKTSNVQQILEKYDLVDYAVDLEQ